MSAFRRSKLSSILLRTLVASFALAGLAFGAENPLGEIMTNSDGAITNSPVDGVTLRYIEVNDITMRIAEAGDDGPLVLLAHGWPESWYSWRHQLKYLSELGYRVVAPDMRGYGGTDAPIAVDDYNIENIAADMVGILDRLGEERAVMVGHDWGAIVAWQTVQFYPNRFDGLIAMSVPFAGRQERSPMVEWRETFGDNFYYILYHNEPNGVAEREYDSNPRELLSRLYLSPRSPRESPAITDPRASAGGWIGRLGAPKSLPSWLSAFDLNYFVGEFERAGFRGGVNYYRNFHRNWELTESLKNAHIGIPTLFIAGERDVVIGGASEARLQGAMSRVVNDLRGVILVPEVGHWVQQEAPDVVNQAMSDFLTDANIIP
jgi:pimeloyl-ACP methyl ester carboxylesterase